MIVNHDNNSNTDFVHSIEIVQMSQILLALPELLIPWTTVNLRL